MINEAVPFLELDNVSRVYGEQVKVYALRDVSLRIRAGDFMSIVGPSGSGKSTMLGLLGCLDQVARETLLVDLYRRDEITEAQLARALGIHRLEIDALLKSHGVMMTLSEEEFASDLADLRMMFQSRC